jgi:hypothetical protein
MHMLAPATNKQLRCQFTEASTGIESCLQLKPAAWKLQEQLQTIPLSIV